MVDRNERLEKILRKFDLDYSASENARTEARNDLFFSRVSQWDDWLESYVTLQYRGQFDVVRPMVRKLVAEMRKNPIEVQYRPKDNAPADAADILMGMYRTDMRNNSSKIAVNVAVREQIECGYGAWRLVTEYEDDNPTSNNQIIRRVPMHESCTHVIWDCNAKAMDKSDAKNCTIIHAMNIDGWEAFAEQYGLDHEIQPSFQSPNNDLLFTWSNGKTIHVAEYYEVEEKRELVFVYRDPLTNDLQTYSAKEAKEKIDELANAGYQKVGERRVKKRRVYKSIITNTGILKDKMPIAGEHIPIVPVYGEWSFFDDNELYEGVVRLSKDAQMLRNFILSKGADTVAKSPKKKPFFYPEQIAGYEHMFTGEDDYPYYLLNRTDENNGDLPPAPISYMENAEISPADAGMLEVATLAAKETARVGVDVEAANGQVAFDTVNQLNSRIDLETYVFQDNLAIAMRRDGEIYASIAAEIYDTNRTVTTTSEDGSENQIDLMQEELDFRKGEMIVRNDIRGKYETFTDVGPSFQSQKDAARAEIGELIVKVPVEHPMWNVMMLTYANMMEGKGVEYIRGYANKELIVSGLKKPELANHETRITAAEEKIVEHEIRINDAELRLGDHETRLTTVESDITYLTEQVVILDYRTTRKKSELTFSGISLSIPTTPSNLITLLKTLTPTSGSFAPFFDITNDKLTVFNEDKTLAFKLSIIGSWTGGTTNRSMQLTFSGATPDTIVVSRNAATSTDNVLMATFFSVDKDGFLATNGSTMTIQSNGSAFTATTIKLIAEQ